MILNTQYIVVAVDFVAQNGYNTVDILWISLAGIDYGKKTTGTL